MTCGLPLLTALQRSAVAAVLFLGAIGTSARAQAVRGMVVDASERPVAGVVVQLLKNDSTAVRALSNARGEYRIVAPAAGAYRLRALRIGFRPSLSERFEIAAGRETIRHLHLSGLAVSLDTVRVAGRSACQLVGDSSAATFAVWEQVRTALTAAQLTDSARISATTVTYERTLDPTAKRVWKQSYAVRSDLVTQPWISMPAGKLHTHGYVQSAADVSTYFAPGIDALLSGEFLADHCVRLAASSDSLLVGLAFEPTPERQGVPEIRGILWVDRRSSELRRLEFSYANLPRAQQDRAGGEVDFARMRDGQWVISRWNIRMPRLLLGMSSGSETRVAEIAVAGGELSLVRRGADTIWSRPPVTIAGTVSDSVSGTFVGAATVALRGTVLETRSDALGRFRLAGVLPGEYTVDVRTPALDSLSAVSQSRLVVTDSTRDVQLRVPSSQQIATAICGSKPLDAPGILAGNVDMLADSLPRGVRILAEWYEAGSVRSEGGAVAARRSRWVDARADAEGRFRMCGLPIGTTFHLRASADGARSAAIDVRIPAGSRFVRADLILERASGNAVFAGSVVSDSLNAPLVDVEVALPGLGRSVLTDARGDFRIADIPEGRHRVTARRIGYGAVEDLVVFEAGAVVQRRLVMGRAARLDTAAVVDNGVIPSFEAHRRMALGVFITRDDLAKQGGRKMGDVLTQVRGLIITPGYCPSALEGATLECGCYSQVYRDRVLMNPGRPTPPFDTNVITTDDIEAVEFYGSAAESPMEYAKLNSPCGVLVFHTRRRP